MRKRMMAGILAVVMILATSITAFAGTWENTGTWKYKNDNGSYSKNTWQWIDGKCYCFDADGNIYANTTTPDGYKVNADGAWINDKGEVQTQSPAGSGSGNVDVSAIKSKFHAAFSNGLLTVDNSKPAWNNGVTNIKIMEHEYNGIIWYSIWDTASATTNSIDKATFKGGYTYVYYQGGTIAAAFNSEGYMMADTYTPDGYYVNSLGVVTINGIPVSHSSDHAYPLRYDDGTPCNPNHYDTSRVSVSNTHTMPFSAAFMPWGHLIYMCFDGKGNPAQQNDAPYAF